jgi:hypothetical protein
MGSRALGPSLGFFGPAVPPSRASPKRNTRGPPRSSCPTPRPRSAFVPTNPLVLSPGRPSGIDGRRAPVLHRRPRQRLRDR